MENTGPDPTSDANKESGQPDGRIDRTRYFSYLTSSALANAALPIFYIFIPIYAVKIGANALELGLVGGASYAVYSFMPFVMGHFSDRRGSRIFFIMLSFVLLALVSFLYSLTSKPLTLIVIRILEGTGWAMLWPAIEAAFTEDPQRDSKRNLGIFNLTWSGGAAFGPAIGTFLVTTYSYSAAFFTTGILFVFLIALNAWAFIARKRDTSSQVIMENAPKKESNRRESTSASIRGLLISNESKRNLLVWTAVTTTVLAAITSGVFFAFFGPYARSLGLGLFLIGAITTTYGAMRFITYLSLSKSSLRQWLFENSKKNLVAFAGLTALSPLILMIRDHSGTLYFLAFVVFAICYSLVYTISQGILIAETSKEKMGAGAGLFESSIGFGGFIGPVIGGAISTTGALQVSFLVPTLGLGFALVLLYVLSSMQNAKRD